MHIKNLLFATLGVLVLGCGGEEPDPQKNPPPPVPWVNPTPKLLMVTPNAMAVGEKLTILGQDFIDATHGYPALVIKGNYTDTTGSVQKVDLQYKATTVNSGKLTWSLWPNIVFHNNGDKLGAFVGNVTVVNVGKDGSQRISDSLPMKLTMKPSIIMRVARPANSNCASVVTKTLEGTPYAFTAEVIGLRDGTKDNPMEFMWTFLADQWNVAWSYNTFNPDAVFPKSGAFVIEEKVTGGRTSVISDAGSKNFLVKVGSDLLGNAKLKELKTGMLPDKQNTMTSSVNLVVRDGSGKTAKLGFQVNISKNAILTYDGNQKIVERYPPVRVTDCIPGADIGRQLTYSEDTSESRSRSVSKNYNTNVGVNFAPIPSNPFALGINLSVGFGVDVNASLSTSKSKGLNISGQVLPGQYAVFYRQTTKMHRVGRLTVRNKCGEEAQAGEVICVDWMYTPELATGPRCTPPSQLPKAGKFY